MAGFHTVEQGECLASLAAKNNLAGWRSIYDRPENASFRAKRPNPNLIYPGDRVYIPDADPGGVNKPTDQKHTFTLIQDKTLLRIVIADQDGNPYGQCDYSLTIGENTAKGKTDGQGLLEEEIDPKAQSGVLTVWFRGAPRRHCTWSLSIGHLDPVAQVSGIQARLNNLDFNSGPVDGIRGPITTAAVKDFQTKHNLEVDGIPGPITQKKLKEVYGC
jgi:Putative peptidoglycan binding domain